MLAAVLLAGLATNPSVAASTVEPEGSIIIESAVIRTELNSWLLDAEAAIELTPAMQAGLDSGVPLTFIVDFALSEPRDLWADAPILGFTRRYRLIYYELTRHYRVQAVNRGASRNYRSLLSALDGLGSLRSLRIGRPTIMNIGDRIATLSTTDQSIQTGVEQGETESPSETPSGRAGGWSPLLARLRIRFDSKALPLPLQPLFGSTWRLSEASHEWVIN